MKKTDFMHFRSIFSIIFLTVLSFMYLEQRMSLIKQNYHQAGLKRYLKIESLKKEELVCKIEHLENPVLLRDKLLASKAGFNFAKSARVVKVPFIRPVEKKEGPSYSGNVSFAVEIP